MTSIRTLGAMSALMVMLTGGVSAAFATDAAPAAPAPAAPAAIAPAAAPGEKAPADEKGKGLVAVDAVVERVQKAYEGMKAFRANVTQTSRLSTLSREEVQKGSIVMAKPGRMRWVFTEPQERLFVSDGKTLYMYSKEDNQVIVQPLSETGGVGVDFLLGLGNIRKDFEVASVPEAEYAKTGRDALGLTPRKPSGAIARMIFSVDASSGLVQEVWTFDAMGNRTHLEFDDLKVNPEVDEKQFQFTPPEGAEILNAGGM